MKNNKRSALITGAAGLLGPQHAAALIEKGFQVVLIDLDLKGLKKTRKNLIIKYPNANIIIHSIDI